MQAAYVKKDSKLRIRIFDKYLLLVCLIFLMHLIINLCVIHQDNTPLIADASGYYCNTIGLYRNLEFSNVRPPFLSIMTIPFIMLFGVTQDAAVLVSSLFLLILLLSTYFLCVKFFSKQTGVLAVLILSSYPIIFGHARTYMPDLPLTAIVTSSFLFLVLSQGFYRRLYAVLWGISCGIGLLLKPEFFIHVIGPVLLYILWMSRRDFDIIPKPAPCFSSEKKPFCLIGFCAGIIIIIGIAALWYVPNLETFINFHAQMRNVRTQALSIFTFDIPSIIDYLILLVRYQIYSLHFIFFSAMAGFIAFRGRLKQISFFLIWIIVPYFILVLCFQRNIRYTMPCLPAFAIITAYGVFQLISKIRRRLVILCVICLCLWNIYFFTYSNLAACVYPHIYNFIFCNRGEMVPHYGLLMPNKTRWDFDKIIDIIENDMPEKNIVYNVMVLTTQTEIDAPLHCYFISKNVHLKSILNLGDICVMRANAEFNRAKILKALVHADYIIKTKPDFENSTDLLDKQLLTVFNEHKHKFLKLKEIAMPSQVMVEIYRRVESRE